MDNIYGSNLLKLRKSRKISQEELAKHVQSTKSTISKYERGDVTPTLDVAKRIASYFGISVDEMTRSNNPLTNSITERSAKELIGLPKGYINVIKLAYANDISPEQLEELILFTSKIKNKTE